MIRQEIQQTLQEERLHEATREAVRGQPHARERFSNDDTCTFSGDDFSDPWAEDGSNTRPDSLTYCCGPPKRTDSYDDNSFFDDSLLQGHAATHASFPTQGDAGEWAPQAAVPLSRQGARDAPPPPPPPPSDPDTPETTMGRHGRLRAKMATYIVQRNDDGEESSCSYSALAGEDYGDELGDYSPNYLPKQLLVDYPSPPMRRSTQMSENSSSPTRPNPATSLVPRTELKNLSLSQSSTGSPTSVAMSLSEVSEHYYDEHEPLPSPLTVEYKMLLADPAFVHAQRSGCLWQSLVGQQLRFPSHWYHGARSPPMGGLDREVKWCYNARFQVRSNRHLNLFVKDRSKPGRLLLHVVVQDLMTLNTIQDIVVGCFHPSARGIRKTDRPDAALDKSRDVWMAVRKHDPDCVSCLDRMLITTSSPKKSPLGGHKRVTNDNVRAVFGDQPPLQTVFVRENELYERLAKRLVDCADLTTPMALLHEYVFP